MKFLPKSEETTAGKSGGKDRRQMDVVVVGHVDHGKSTVIGRLMADTGTLPEGKLDQVKATCERNARPFEYAFLLDALKSEQAQGITIDTARCFFKTQKRHYIIHDAPGHIEFLKNMVTGAARAEAALLVIDALEGIQENSRRHGYILSMLGIRQVAVLVNKMDLVAYDRKVFETISAEYAAFLENLGVQPEGFIPISAREGINLTARGEETAWYEGPTVLEQVDAFDNSEGHDDRPFRMPVQDIYKFTAQGDDRRIIAGTVESGTLQIGDELLFLPSGKSSVVKTLESFNAEALRLVSAGQAVGFTLTTQIYLKPGELAVRKNQKPPLTGSRLRASIFWMGHAPMIPGRRYKMKLGSMQVPVELVETESVLDASDLTSIQGKKQIDRHDVGVCLLETARPAAFDISSELEKTARFVIVDNFEIAGCGIVLEGAEEESSLLDRRVRQREAAWRKGYIHPAERAAQYQHNGKCIIFIGGPEVGTEELAKKLELKLFLEGAHTYYLSLANVFDELALGHGETLTREEHLQQLGEMARIMTDAGLLFITALNGVDDFDMEKLKLLNAPNELFVIRVGETLLSDFPLQATLPSNPNVNDAIREIVQILNTRGILPEYTI